MRKTFCIISVLLISAIGAPRAHADSYNPTFTCSGTCVSIPTAPAVSFPAPTTITETWDSLVFTITLPAGDLPTDMYQWTVDAKNTNSVTATILDQRTLDRPFDQLLMPPPIATLDYGSLTFTLVATPEPPTGSLMLVGIGLVLLLRKRNSRGHQLAT